MKTKFIVGMLGILALCLLFLIAAGLFVSHPAARASRPTTPLGQATAGFKFHAISWVADLRTGAAMLRYLFASDQPPTTNYSVPTVLIASATSAPYLTNLQFVSPLGGAWSPGLNAVTNRT